MILIRLQQREEVYLTITGGEPTLLGDNLFRLLSQLKLSLPKTELHILTNGRAFAWPLYAQQFASVGHPNISLGDLPPIFSPGIMRLSPVLIAVLSLEELKREWPRLK